MGGARVNLLARVCRPFLAGYFLSYVNRAVNAVLGPQLAGQFVLSAADLGLLTRACVLGFGIIRVPRRSHRVCGGVRAPRVL